jgi:hypothetical protein
MSQRFISRFFIGGKITKVELLNIDLANILPKVTNRPYVIHKYGDLTPEMKLPYWMILLYQYPRQIGHWVLLECDAEKKVIYFFDPYGTPPDHQWPYLENPEMLPEPPHVLTQIIRRYVIEEKYRFHYNSYNIQGTIRNGDICDFECGEIVILRILYEDLTDAQFYSLCMRLGRHQIFKIIKKIDVSENLGQVCPDCLFT